MAAAGRRTPVVGVFGSTLPETLGPARDIGEAVARAGCVLLTGGGHDPHEASVKEQALAGARVAERAGVPAPRVGVLGVEATRVGVVSEGAELVLAPALGDGRNYLNAAMCDVAVALPGGPGTDSEVAFALALGRPVLLVGEGWDRLQPSALDRAAREALLASARRRVPGGDGSVLARLVSAAYDALLAVPRLPVERVGPDESATDVARRARRLAVEVGPVGEMPLLADRPDLATLAGTYAEWLARVDGGT